jgi:hypothetical protein
MTTPIIPDAPIKKKVGRPRKNAPKIPTEAEAGEVVVASLTPACVAQEVEAVPLRSALMLDQVIEVKQEEKPRKPSKRVYGSKEEVYEGLFEKTRSGLTKDDLTKTAKGKIVSHKQLKALAESAERIRKSGEGSPYTRAPAHPVPIIDPDSILVKGI